MHPFLKPGVSLGTFNYSESDDTHHYIENSAGEMFEISSRLYCALLKADGTKPLDLPSQGRKILTKLKRNWLVQTSRLVNDGFMNRFILLKFAEFSRKMKTICMVFNTFLPVIAVLALIAGVVFINTADIRGGFDFCLPLYYALFFASIALHEVGHLIAGIAYGYKISDAGILLLWRIPIGGYVAYENARGISRKGRLQFALAGVEMDMLVAGLCLIMSVAIRRFSFTFTMIANANIFLALVNLIPSYGLDGEAALSALLGVGSIYKLSKRWVRDRRNRLKLIKKGLRGFLCFGFFLAIQLSKVLIWLVIGVNVVITIFCAIT